MNVSEEIKAIGIIPARMGSSRFPGKPLVPILGLPMVMHVYFRALRCQALGDVYIATPDQEIVNMAKKYDAKVVMTSPLHERCTDRVAEAIEILSHGSDIVVNIQGDEPMLYPELVNSGVEALLADKSLPCAHPIARIQDMGTFQNRNVIKVVKDKDGFVLYMSREPIPTMVRLGEAIKMFQLIVVLAFRRKFLSTYSRLTQTPLEQAESVDIIRILEHGYKIKTVEVSRPTISIDVPSDVARVEAFLKQDPMVKDYLPQAILRAS